MAVSSVTLASQLVCLVIFIGAFNLASSNVESGSNVPPGYTAFENIGVAYKVHTEKLNWELAKQACRNEHAHLAIIDTMEKVRYVAGLKGFNVYVWTGISRPESWSEWVTSGTKTVMPNFPWAPGKPAGPHNCIAVRGCNRGLTNERCTDQLGFVCQIPLESSLEGVTIY